MKLIDPEIHVHRYTRQATKSVRLYREELDQVTGRASKGASVAGKDVLKLRMCMVPIKGKPCGKVQAYDLERTVA